MNIPFFETVIVLIAIKTLACSNSIPYNTLHINNNSSNHLKMSAPNPLPFGLPFGASRAMLSVPPPQFVAWQQQQHQQQNELRWGELRSGTVRERG